MFFRAICENLQIFQNTSGSSLQHLHPTRPMAAKMSQVTGSRLNDQSLLFICKYGIETSVELMLLDALLPLADVAMLG